MKIPNIDTEVPNIFLKDLKSFNEIFRKNVTYANIKSHEKPVFHLLFRSYFFRKTTVVLSGPYSHRKCRNRMITLL